jgi:hypothetical protein
MDFKALEMFDRIGKGGNSSVVAVLFGMVVT